MTLANSLTFGYTAGFVIKAVGFTEKPLLDALEREAVAQTRIVGREFRLLIHTSLSEEELSVTLYHEVLEAPRWAACTRRKASWTLTKPASSERPAKHTHAGAMPRRPTSTACCNSTVFVENKVMVDRDKTQFDLIKLSSGERILRLTEPRSGLSLEKKHAPADAVVPQKERLERVFEAALAKAELAA